MKVAIGASFFTEWYVDVDSGHSAKVSAITSFLRFMFAGVAEPGKTENKPLFIGSQN
jgi:hypothetical protein